MIAVDTNIVLRLILGDDAAQEKSIRALMTRDQIFISLSVLLETGWVLESRYRLSRDEVATALSSLLLLDGVAVARSEGAFWAIERYRGGADWADMIHIVSARKIGTFATLDRRLGRGAGDDTPVAIETLS